MKNIVTSSTIEYYLTRNFVKFVMWLATQNIDRGVRPKIPTTAEKTDQAL